jgi:hypothetical protein
MRYVLNRRGPHCDRLDRRVVQRVGLPHAHGDHPKGTSSKKAVTPALTRCTAASQFARCSNDCVAAFLQRCQLPELSGTVRRPSHQYQGIAPQRRDRFLPLNGSAVFRDQSSGNNRHRLPEKNLFKGWCAVGPSFRASNAAFGLQCLRDARLWLHTAGVWHQGQSPQGFSRRCS